MDSTLNGFDLYDLVIGGIIACRAISPGTAKKIQALQYRMVLIIDSRDVPEYSDMQSVLEMQRGQGLIAGDDEAGWWATDLGRTYWAKQFGLLDRLNKAITEGG